MSDYFATKYSNARNEALHLMCQAEWANEHTGDVESPVGYVYRISNTLGDMGEIGPGFSEEFGELGVTAEQMIGHFLVVENDQGFVRVVEFGTEEAAKAAFGDAEKVYDAWLDGLYDAYAASGF